MARLTFCGVVVEEAAFFSDLKPGTLVALSYVDDPDVRHEAFVTWPCLGVDRDAAILSPDDDYFGERRWSECGAFADRSLQLLCEPVMSCSMAVSIVSDRVPVATSSLASLMKDDACSRLTAISCLETF